MDPDRRGMGRPASLFLLCTLLMALVAACAGISDSSETPPLPYKAEKGAFYYFDGEKYRKIFIKGINLGVGVPGTEPGELGVTEEQYARWFEMMADAGFNAIRIYTLHPPRFYRLFADYNRNHPDRPLYLFHGIWLDEAGQSSDLFSLTGQFQQDIREAVDAVHGNAEIEHRYGKAYGTYETDVSPWLMGWIIGREISPKEVIKTNQAHATRKSYRGRYVGIGSGDPVEAWLAERLDYLVRYEKERYGAERPISVSNWPTLDPLSHETESISTFEDVVAIDLAQIETYDFGAGYFASYHAYPYYPDFMSEDPAYAGYADDYGPNSYLGYLHALRQHYGDIPLIIAEYGVPSSWGNAHYAQSGMHHGGHDETQQGEYAGRMLENIYDARCAGGMYFAWMDEWWKPSWVTEELEFPRERLKLWHNVTAPEQNYGFIAFDTGAPDFQPWNTTQRSRAVDRLEAAADAAFFYARITLTRPPAALLPLTIGFDTYGDDVGESILPDGATTPIRSEFALQISSPSEAQLMVTQAYDLFGIWHHTSSPAQQYHSIATDGAPWGLVRWKNNSAHGSDDGRYWFPETIQEIGKLEAGQGAFGIGSHQAVVLDKNSITVRLPWTLLQFSDPSSRSVIDDRRETDERETIVSDGIRIAFAVDNEFTVTDRFAWDRWDSAPATTERKKESWAILSEVLKSLP